MPEEVSLHLDADELPPPANAIGPPARRGRPSKVVPGTLLARDADLDAVRDDFGSLGGFRIDAEESLGSGWTLIRFRDPAGVDRREALGRALNRLNAPAAPGRAARTPRVFANRIVACPRLIGGGLPSAPDESEAPTGNLPLGQGPGQDVTVAVLDTKPMFHADLAPQLVDAPAAQAPVDADTSSSAIGHCLLVAGIVLRVAPAAKVKLVGVLDNDGTGSEAALAKELNKIAGQGGVDIINLSLCTPELQLPAVEDALARLHAEGVGVVAAAGNAIDDYPLTGPMLPAAFPNVAGVAAMDGIDADGLPVPQLAAFSQRGPWVDALAQGARRFGSFVTGKTAYGAPEAPVKREFAGWCFWDGTSFAAPAVAGAAAAHLAAERAQGIVMTGAQAVAAVLAAGAPVANLPDGVTAPVVAAPVVWPAPLPAVRSA